MIKFQSFLSGSSGNATFVTDGITNLLVDCGANGKYITDCLSRISVKPESISAILITHEHIDHTAGVGVMSRKYGINLYASTETWEGMPTSIGKINQQNIFEVKAGNPIVFGNIEITPFSTPHDANGSVGYRISSNGVKAAIATDTGHISDELLSNLSGCESVIIEANHDVEMLKNGRYPFFLKKRILSDFGHLSNDDCAKLSVMLAKTGTKSIWLGHLSKENNRPELAYDTVKQALTENGFKTGKDISLNVLPPKWK